MIKVVKREELTELEKDGSWKIGPPFSEWNETKEFQYMEQALKWVIENLPIGVKLSDLDEVNGNDLQVNVNDKVLTDSGEEKDVGKNLAFIFYEETEIDTAKLIEKIRKESD